MKLGSKADLLKCLEREEESPEMSPPVEVSIHDGAAIVQSLDPNRSDKRVLAFSDYALKLVLPYLSKQLMSVDRVDVVWDTYNPNSLNVHTRHSRGSGDKIRVNRSTRIPAYWKSFLRVDENKKTLYEFLATQISLLKTPPGKVVLTTFRENVLVANSSTEPVEPDISNIQPCNHKEAYPCMILHAVDAYKQGYKRVILHATDTNVLVLTICTISQFENCELWLAFGHTTNISGTYELI
ncbi:hypothetical protein DPMN_088682 [Dreissena polymorpha]|uniref:Uncharacterized protein n=1 Tax=Dreissena polymorpha TaxID=45954 RepID=A0A9D4KUZ3_DREPO|nr:hypothetical protein DPMN_088682 [Dreissena polymorpha]